MTISYKWLCDYLSEKPEPEELSHILTSIGLEVESLNKFEEVKGGFNGLITGEVITCEKHPDADKLKVTTVAINSNERLQIVCGAANVAVGQKVVVATVGTTIHPFEGEPIALKKAKIRGVESQGMICAEDEIGLSNNHDGIMILPAETKIGENLSLLLKPFDDNIFEIGLTPNRMDAMSHIGVAKDVVAWLAYHRKTAAATLFPYSSDFPNKNKTPSISITIENAEVCKRYSGVRIQGITVTDSPKWLQQKLKSIGLKPINNIVDITNFILHETGQPLHAFDADKIAGNQIVVKTAIEGSSFLTLDEKERKLSGTDLMIWNKQQPMCIAGIYGGVESGVNKETKNIFLESACFDPSSIRRTSVKHGLRTDAATRFEKGTDISNTVIVARRAALMIAQLAGGEIESDIIDIYPQPLAKTEIEIYPDYIKKLSGKWYPVDAIKCILGNLGFEILSENEASIKVNVPYSKHDIKIPADIVEEIMRIDGLDNISIPSSINISPSVEKQQYRFERKEKAADFLTGLGFSEIFTNSITNSSFYDQTILETSVKMINSLSADLDIMRPQMIQGGLQVLAHNINRKNADLRFFEFGKTYRVTGLGKYEECVHLSLYTTGNTSGQHWKVKQSKSDIYYLKGALQRLFQLSGIENIKFEVAEKDQFENAVSIRRGNVDYGYLGQVSAAVLKQFDIRQPVFYADVNWEAILDSGSNQLKYREISKFPAVTRDLALVVDKNVSYNQVEGIALSGKIRELESVKLFDVFESEKLGEGKKSMAVSFTFLDETKTLTDKEIDAYMQKIISNYEQNIGAEIRK